jgi:hypothetical protein
MKDKYETHIVLIPVSSLSDGRKKLESIEGEKFDNRTALENALCFDEDDPMATEDLRVIPISEFTEWMNDHDDDMKEEDKFKVGEFWMGYVEIKKRNF